MNLRRRLTLIAVASLCAALPAAAQEWKGKGKITGLVTDQADKPVVGASIKIHLSNDPAAGPPAAISNDKGKFEIEKLAYGTWTMEITAPGFDPQGGPVPITKEQSAVNVTVKLLPENIAGRAIDAGNKLFNQHKWAEARAEYEKAIAALSPEQAATHKRGLLMMMAQADVRLKQSPRAIEAMQALVTEKPDDHEALRILAQAQREAGQKDAAIESLKRVATLQPTDVAVADFLLEWLVEAKRLPEAEEVLAKAPGKIDPISIVNMGIQYFNAKQFAPAIAKFDAVVAGHPERTDVLYFRGLCHMEMKNLPQARADFEKLLSLDPKAPKAADARLKLAILDYEAKDFTAALGRLDALAQEMPQKGEVFYFRGFTKMALKKNTEAKADLQQFLTLSPADPRVAEVQGLVKKLK